MNDDLRAAAQAATTTDAGLGFVCEPQGHGKPDHCSVHGDIPRTTSIISHIESAHAISREEYYALQEAAAARLAATQRTFARLASPDRILALCDDNKELRAALERLVVYADGPVIAGFSEHVDGFLADIAAARAALKRTTK